MYLKWQDDAPRHPFKAERNTTMPRAFPEERLSYMLGEMRTQRVEDLDHRDYQSLLRVLGILVEGMGNLAQGEHPTGARKILAKAAARAARDQLPMPATDPEPTPTDHPDMTYARSVADVFNANRDI